MLKNWKTLSIGDRVIAGTNQRDIGTVLETGPDATAAGRAFVKWDDGSEPSWLRADLLGPSPHVEDDDWKYLVDLLLDGEITVADFRRKAESSGYCAEQINNAIDFNWSDIVAMTAPEAEAA